MAREGMQVIQEEEEHWEEGGELDRSYSKGVEGKDPWCYLNRLWREMALKVLLAEMLASLVMTKLWVELVSWKQQE